MHTINELLNNKSTVVVDVRNSWEYEMDHITEKKNIPLEEISGNIELFKSFNNPVVLYCRSGNRSGMATSILKQNGLTEVYNGGGLDDMKTFLN